MYLLLQTLLFLGYCSALLSQEIKADENLIFALQESLVGSHPHKPPPIETEPFQLTLSADCEPLTTVAGCVNVLSGQFFQIEKDLIGNTIEPLSLIRYYDSGNTSESFLGYGFGSEFPLWASESQKGARHHYVMISEREGFLLPYRDKEGGPSKICWIDPRVLKKGYTNLSRAAMSGHANFINRTASFQTTLASPDGKWIVQLGDGTERIYDKYVKIPKDQQARIDFPTKTAYLLTQEIKPNGNQLHFSYETFQGQPCLKQVRTLNRTGETTLNELNFTYSAEPKQALFSASKLHHLQSCTVSNSFGDQVDYQQEEKLRPLSTTLGIRQEIRKFLVEVSSSHKGLSHYKMGDLKWKIKEIQRPRNRFLHIVYNSAGKVKALYEPLESQEAVKRYEFHYHSDSTDVSDALGHLTSYHFDPQDRLSQLRYYDKETCMRQDLFEWSARKGEEGWLKSKSVQLGKNLYYLKTYRYDIHGNVIQEALYGNLTGEKAQTFFVSQKKEMDQARIHYTYFYNERNLLKEKSTSEGLVTSYDYLAGTNLCTSILLTYQGKIQERTFRTYDDNGQLQTLTEDDGSSEKESDLNDVTFRRMTEIEAVTEPGAAFGKPQKISQFYRHHQTEKPILLTETTLTYDVKGWEKERTVCDSQGNTCYMLTKKYDDRLRLKEESNALDHITRYDYDDSDNKIEEELIGSGRTIQYEYDLGNRLVKKIETHKDRKTFVTTYAYNALDQLISQTDPYDQETTYQYDRFGNPTTCIKPAIPDANGKLISPTIYQKYNLLNQLISETDEKGHVTTYSYNVYGSPTQITYPDQAKEHFRYTPYGWLKQKWNADGTSMAYEYDAKGHIIKEEFFDAKNQLVKKEEYCYKGPLLQSKVDGQGLVTTYKYDGAGRKIAEHRGSLKSINYTYDDLGRLILKEQNGRQEIVTYDALDRPLSKTLQDSFGNLYAKEQVEYDMDGNQTKTTLWQTPLQQSSYCSQYDSANSLQWKEDPLEHRTSWE